ncbi:hypothetical protein B9Z55_023219 [Caenorhabditis nigoni]|nr:hypothetical protein B9Z55_023219 [Caenorhabditis nigoni]
MQNNLAHTVSPTQNQQGIGRQDFLSYQISQLRDQSQVGAAQNQHPCALQVILNTQPILPLQGFAPQQTLQAFIAQQQQVSQQRQLAEQQQKVAELQLQQQQQQTAELQSPTNAALQALLHQTIEGMTVGERKIFDQLRLNYQRQQVGMAPPNLLYGMNNGVQQVAENLQPQLGAFRPLPTVPQPMVQQQILQQSMVPHSIAYDFLTAQQRQLHQIQLANAEQQQRQLQNQALEAQMIAGMQLLQQNRPEVNHQMQDIDRPQLTPQEYMRVQTQSEQIQGEVVAAEVEEIVGNVEMGVDMKEEVASPEVLLRDAPEKAPVLEHAPEEAPEAAPAVDVLPELDLEGFVHLPNVPTTSSFAMNFDLLQGIRDINLGASSASSGDISPGSEASINQVFTLPLYPPQGFQPFIPQNQRPSVFGKATLDIPRRNINVSHNPMNNITKYRDGKKPSKRELFLQMDLEINKIPLEATKGFCSKELKTATAELLYLFKEHYHIYHEFIAAVIKVPSGTLSKIYESGKNRRIQTLSAYHEAILDQHLHALLNFSYQLLFCPEAVPFMLDVGRPTSFGHRWQMNPRCYKSTGQKGSDAFLLRFQSMMNSIKMEVDKIHPSQMYGVNY